MGSERVRHSRDACQSMTFDLSHTYAFLDALAGRDAVYDWRLIHDVNKAADGVSLRGTLTDNLATIEVYQAAGYGAFIVVNETDGRGRSAENVVSFRANFIDSDDADSQWTKWQRVAAWENPPTFFVQGAVAGKFHAYWIIEPHNDVTRWQNTQRKLITMFSSDDRVNDPPRVMRVPGSLHLKNSAAPATVGFIAGSGRRYSPGVLEWSLASVTAAGGGGERDKLGASDLQAPSLEWALYSLNKIDPNTLARDEWIKLSAAFKQSAWSFADEATLLQHWQAWCARYTTNDPGENQKNWRSFRETKTGWQYLARYSGAAAELAFGGQPVQMPIQADKPRVVSPVQSAPGLIGDPVFLQAVLRTGSPILTPQEQIDYFAGCVYIERLEQILTPNLRFMGPGGFNASYGGSQFVLTDAKLTDEPWKAATRGPIFQVPKVDDIRFLPSRATGEVITDELGRKAINIYRPVNVITREGDVTPFTAFLRAILATERDYDILVNYMRHVVQRPGVKALWCPVIQSVEGAGKGIIGECLEYAVGTIYTYQPNAQLLADSGSKFNAWMRAKLLIIANEIKTDEGRVVLEILKPMITERRLELQGKGANQEMEDNVSNWIMFTNYKNAVPITRTSRRYAIFYSTLQDTADIAARGMSGDYFPRMYDWVRNQGGREFVAHWLRSTPIDPALDPAGAAHRAPETSSTVAALTHSLGPVEQRIMEAVEGREPGFRGGWLSSAAVSRMLSAAGVRTSPQTLSTIYGNLGYYEIGRASRAYLQEDAKQPKLWNIDKTANIANYAVEQGYEIV
jgi:hypothetical protein